MLYIDKCFTRRFLTLFDLLFLLLLLTVAAALLMAGINAMRGRRAKAAAIVVRCAAGAAIYFCVLALVSLVTPQRFLGRGEEQCSDDWCVAVDTIGHQTGARDNLYDVTFRLSSRAARVAQRERFVVAYLRDTAGRRYDAEGDTGAVPFDTLLAPLQTVTTTRHFRVPGHATIEGVVITREGGGRFPRCCIIGENGSLLHKPAVVRLD